MSKGPKYFHEFFDVEGKPTHPELIVQRLKKVISGNRFIQTSNQHFWNDTSKLVAEIDGNLWQFEVSLDSWDSYEDGLGDYFNINSVVMVQEAQKTITVYEPVERPSQAKVLQRIREFEGTGGPESYDSLEREINNTIMYKNKTKQIGPFNITLVDVKILDAGEKNGSNKITYKSVYDIDGFPFIMHTIEDSWETVFDLDFSRLKPARKVMVEDYEEVK